MSKPITVPEALRLIELAREVDGKAEPSGIASRTYWTGPWERSDSPQVEAIQLWRASYGALLDALEANLRAQQSFQVQRLGREPNEFPIHPVYLAALAPLITWADANHPDWRTG